jgi:hypothetical protein
MCGTYLFNLISFFDILFLLCFRQRLDFLRQTFQDLENGRLRRIKESLTGQKALKELDAEKNDLRLKLQELDAKRELQQQLFDKFMITTKNQLEQQLADIESIECLAAASSSELVIRSLEVVEPIKSSLAQSIAELIYAMCAHYSSFTQDSTRNVYETVLSVSFTIHSTAFCIFIHSLRSVFA